MRTFIVVVNFDSGFGEFSFQFEGKLDLAQWDKIRDAARIELRKKGVTSNFIIINLIELEE